MLIGQSKATDILIHETDFVKVMVTIDVSALRSGLIHLNNATKFLGSSREVRRFFFRNTSGKTHIISSLAKEVVQDAKLTNALAGSLLNTSANVTNLVRSKRWDFLGNVLHLTTWLNAFHVVFIKRFYFLPYSFLYSPSKFSTST